MAEHLQKLSIAAQSDTLPDVFWVYKSTAEEMQEAGKLLDLAPVLDELGLTDSFPESTIANFSADDVIYGVPYQGLLTGLWFNEKILADNGLEVPVTFDDLLHVAETLSAKGITTISNGANQSSFSVWSFLVDLDRFGYEEKIDGILDGSEQYDNADFLRLYEHIAELRDAGAFASNVSTQTYQQAVDQFTSGNAAMLDAGVWASSAIQDSPIAPDTGFWTGPQFDDGVGEQNIVMNVASAPFAVSAKVAGDEKKLEAVTKFLDFYYGDEAQQILVDNGQPPVTTYEPPSTRRRRARSRPRSTPRPPTGSRAPSRSPTCSSRRRSRTRCTTASTGSSRTSSRRSRRSSWCRRPSTPNSDLRRSPADPGSARPRTTGEPDVPETGRRIHDLGEFPLEDPADGGAGVHRLHRLRHLPSALLARIQLHEVPGIRRTGVDRLRQLHRPSAADPFFWQSLQNTIIILVVSLAVLIPASFALALLLRRRIAGGGSLRALVFGPAIIAPILVGLIWVFILDPKIGLLNRVLAALRDRTGPVDRRRHAHARMPSRSSSSGAASASR